MGSAMDDLPEPQRAAWLEYLGSELSDRAAMRSALDRFIRSMEDLTLPGRDQWARRIAEQVTDGDERIPVRAPLFVEIILPALVRGLESAEPGCARWLADFDSQLAKAPYDPIGLPDGLRTRAGLLRRALIDDPSDQRAARMLVEELADRLGYSIHEVPAGVLWDNNGATTDQIALLQQDLAEFQGLIESLDLSEEYADLVRACEFHYTEYGDHLTDRQHPTYAAHLEARRSKPHERSIASFTIDDDVGRADAGSIEVTITLSDGTKRWCFFVTPEALAAVGDWLPGRTDVRVHLGVSHMIVVSTIGHSVIETTLRMLEEQGTLHEHTTGLA